MNEIKIFEGTQVHIIEKDGEPMFEVYSTGMALGQVKFNSVGTAYPRKDRIDENLKNAEIIPCVRNGHSYITEEQLYDLMLEMKTDKVKPFRKWVTSEVLPAIRKTGGYVNNDDLFIDTYLPFADDATKLLFKNTLNVINNQNKLISEQKNEIRRKSDVIQGFAEDIPNPTKRKILNEVVRYGGNYKERWNCLYKEFTAVYGIDVSVRYKNYVEKGIKPKMFSKLDYVEKKLDMLDKLYGLAVKLYESDINKIKERYDILSERN